MSMGRMAASRRSGPGMRNHTLSPELAVLEVPTPSRNVPSGDAQMALFGPWGLSMPRPYPAPNIANTIPRMTDCTTHPIAHTPTARHVFV